MDPHTLVHTQKDSTVYKMYVTSQFKLFIQVLGKALRHRKGMRPKENLALALPRPFEEKDPTRPCTQNSGRASATSVPCREGLQLLHPCPFPSSWHEAPQTGRALTCTRPAPPPKLLCAESQGEPGHPIVP